MSDSDWDLSEIGTRPNPDIFMEHAKIALRDSITRAMQAGMTQPEIIEVLESAIGVLKSGDMR